ncbi:hypothetical protein [Yoonia sp. SS1-5]|uniref:DUF2157 domain-containing protein n=1 Tax=Yoonia rhodophyticola TaxID=3137370 RepID=A0AAN0NL43_9RHOB
MIDRNDIKAAVASGLLSEKQAAGLITLADSRRGARENLAAGDEPFELFKGFNEIFIVVGLIILASGWYGVTGLAVGSRIMNLQQYASTICLISAGVIWLLSEYFVRHRRMVAPAIALSIMFAGNAALGFIAYMAEPFMVAQNDLSSIPPALLLATIALLGYWWRFRVPFALAMIAIGLFVTTTMFTASRGGRIEDIGDFFLLSAGGPFAWITLGLGVLVFAIAMLFDMSDPHRVTRRSANGFWLHIVAAPALMNTIALTLMARDANLALLGVLAIFAVVAIIIDRRSFLITAIGYVVALTNTVWDGQSTAMTVLILGIVLLLLGAFWEKIRAAILRLLGGALPLDRLPPSHA